MSLRRIKDIFYCKKSFIRIKGLLIYLNQKNIDLQINCLNYRQQRRFVYIISKQIIIQNFATIYLLCLIKNIYQFKSINNNLTQLVHLNQSSISITNTTNQLIQHKIIPMSQFNYRDNDSKDSKVQDLDDIFSAIQKSFDTTFNQPVKQELSVKQQKSNKQQPQRQNNIQINKSTTIQQSQSNLISATTQQHKTNHKNNHLPNNNIKDNNNKQEDDSDDNSQNNQNNNLYSDDQNENDDNVYDDGEQQQQQSSYSHNSIQQSVISNQQLQQQLQQKDDDEVQDNNNNNSSQHPLPNHHQQTNLKQQQQKQTSLQQSPYRNIECTPQRVELNRDQNQKESQQENNSTINVNSISHNPYINGNHFMGQNQHQHQHQQSTYKQNSKDNNNISLKPITNSTPLPTMNYKQLQQKIQSALKKNNFYNNNNKNNFTNSRKSNQTTITLNQFNQTLINRFEMYQKRRQQQIQQKKLQLLQKKQKQLKFHPTINKKSQQIIQQMGKHQPIEYRYQKLIQAKNKRIQLHQQLKKQKQQQENQLFMQEFMKLQKTPGESTRSPDEFYQQMLRWKQKVIKNAQQKKRLIQEKQILQGNSFTPKINKRSEKIIMTSSKTDLKKPVYEREIPAEKKFKTKVDQQCTFKPKINKRKVR